MQNNFFERLRRHESWLVLLLFVLLTTIAAWNVVTDLNGVIIGDDNDTYINPWADWWTYRAITDPETSLWHTNMMYYPVGAELTYHSFSHLNTLVSLALRPLLGKLPAYNVTILLNFVLAGLSMFHLGRYVTSSSGAGVLAGIVFAFNSQNLYQSAHPVLVSIWCIPWMSLYFIRAVRENNLKLAMLASLMVFFGAATSTLLLVLMVFWLSILVFYMFLATDFPKPQLRVLLTFSGLSGLFILPLIWPLLVAAFAANNSNFIIDPNASIRTDIFSIFVPHWYIWMKRGMYLGIVPFYLAMVAFGHQRKAARLWFILLLIAFLFAIGPVPEIAGYSLQITLPWTLPVAAVLRQLHRMMILFSMGWAMIVAYGWLGFRDLLNKKGTITWLICLMVGLAIFFDFTAVPFPLRPNRVSTFYTEYLKGIPDDIALAIIPTGRQEDKRNIYYQTFHEHPITNGVISRAGEDVFRFIKKNPLLRAGAVDLEPVPLPENPQAALTELAEANIGYLIIDKTLTKDEEVWREYLPIMPVFEDEFLLVYSTGLLNESTQPK